MQGHLKLFVQYSAFKRRKSTFSKTASHVFEIQHKITKSLPCTKYHESIIPAHINTHTPAVLSYQKRINTADEATTPKSVIHLSFIFFFSFNSSSSSSSSFCFSMSHFCTVYTVFPFSFITSI